MKMNKAYTLDYRRKRQGKTNYKARLKLLSSGKLRVVVRRRLNNISVQLVQMNRSGDNVVVSAYTRELLKYGWKAHRGNLSAAYLVGLLCGYKAKKAKHTSGILDLGMNEAVPKSGFFAVVKGLQDSGFDINADKSVLPDEQRLFGKHIEAYGNVLKGKPGYEKQFSAYLKVGLKPEEFSKHVTDVKNKIKEKWQ